MAILLNTSSASSLVVDNNHLAATPVAEFARRSLYLVDRHFLEVHVTA